jgi:hypothetical protein
MAAAAGRSALGGPAHGLLPVAERRDVFDDAFDSLFNHSGADFLQLPPGDDLLLPLHPASGHDLLAQGSKAVRGTHLTRVAFSTGDLESMSYVHGRAKAANSGFTQRYSVAGGGSSSLLFEPLMGGGHPFTVDECDETGADFVPSTHMEPGGVPLHMFTLQKPGVSMPRTAATTRPRSQLSRQPHTNLTAPGVMVPRNTMPAPAANAPAAQSTTSHAAAAAANAKAPVKSAKEAPAMAAVPVEPKRMSQRRIIPTGGTASRPSALRRVHSTGDLSVYSFTDGLRFQAGLGEEGALEAMDDGVYRIGKYTLEERRMRILRYRQKRHERNFDRKIKYACRKTLADSRPRVRGRFAKNEDGPAGMPTLDAMGLTLDDDALNGLNFDEDELLHHRFDIPGWDTVGHSGTTQGGGSSGRQEQQSPMAGMFA